MQVFNKTELQFSIKPSLMRCRSPIIRRERETRKRLPPRAICRQHSLPIFTKHICADIPPLIQREAYSSLLQMVRKIRKINYSYQLVISKLGFPIMGAHFLYWSGVFVYLWKPAQAIIAALSVQRRRFVQKRRGSWGGRSSRA